MAGAAEEKALILRVTTWCGGTEEAAAEWKNGMGRSRRDIALKVSSWGLITGRF